MNNIGIDGEFVTLKRASNRLGIFSLEYIFYCCCYSYCLRYCGYCLLSHIYIVTIGKKCPLNFIHTNEYNKNNNAFMFSFLFLKYWISIEFSFIRFTQSTVATWTVTTWLTRTVWDNQHNTFTLIPRRAHIKTAKREEKSTIEMKAINEEIITQSKYAYSAHV